MRRITLVIILLFSVTAADAAWYQTKYSTIVDPIKTRSGSDLPYSGNNLEPGADLTNADLRTADLRFADLSYADLTGADLRNGDRDYYYRNATWTDAFYYTDNEPIWDSGMDAAWRSSVGILAVAPTSAVPEPATLLLALIGLALLPLRRRR